MIIYKEIANELETWDYHKHNAGTIWKAILKLSTNEALTNALIQKLIDEVKQAHSSWLMLYGEGFDTESQALYALCQLKKSKEA